MNGITTALELQALRTGQNRTQLVDVRSASEYAAGHIPGAMNVPLEQIESRIDDLSADALIVLVCQRGPRASMAATFLDGRRQTIVLEGGTHGWRQAGLPLVAGTKTRWAPERQVRLIAGLMVLAGTSLALLVNANWMLLPGFVGLGLTVAGLTDFCLLGSLLCRMPWNRPGKSTKAATVPTCAL